MTIEENFLTRKQVCETLGISTSTLRRLVDLGDFPQPIQISERRQLFRDNDVFDWLQERVKLTDKRCCRRYSQAHNNYHRFKVCFCYLL